MIDKNAQQGPTQLCAACFPKQQKILGIVKVEEFGTRENVSSGLSCN